MLTLPLYKKFIVTNGCFLINATGENKNVLLFIWNMLTSALQREQLK